MDTEQSLKDALREMLGRQNIKIERSYRKISSGRTILAKLSGFRIKEHIVIQAIKGKPKGNQVYGDFSNVTMETQNKNWEKLKELRAQNKYVI